MKRSLLWVLIGIALGAVSVTVGAEEATSPQATASPGATSAPPMTADHQSDLQASCDVKSGKAKEECPDGARAGGRETDEAPSQPAMQPMTTEEESSSMPQPGQANDHSTLAKKGNER